MHSNSNPGSYGALVTGISGLLAGVDIGGTKTAVVLCAEPPDVIWRAEFATLPALGPDHAVKQIVDLLHRGLIETKRGLSAIGVSCGGPLDRIAGVIQRPPNLTTWNDVAIKYILEERFHVPCRVENDANAGAVAEHRFGAGVGCRHMVFLTLGTGLGAGLILNGSLYFGANAMAGELGHVRLTLDGPHGYGKAGSVEGWASGAGMASHGAETVRQAALAGEQSSLFPLVASLTARDIGEALLEGDAVAARIVEATGQRLGEAITILIDLLNPERVVVGGLALRLGEHLLGPARRRIAEEALPGSASSCSVVRAALGEGIGDAAAICIAMGLEAQDSRG